MRKDLDGRGARLQMRLLLHRVIRFDRDATREFEMAHRKGVGLRSGLDFELGERFSSIGDGLPSGLAGC